MKRSLPALPALLVLALLADLALETFWSGSPVRWWAVAAPVVLAAVLAAGRRMTPHAQARAACLALAAAVGVSAWLPGGLTHGVRMLGMTTPAVLSLTAAMGLAVSAWVTGRSRRLSRGLRAAGALLGAVGALTFVQGAFAGVPFDAATSSESLWAAGPLLLRGAAAAALVVLPLALVGVALDTGLRMPREGSAARPLYEAMAVTAALAVLLAGLPLRSADRASRETSGSNASTPEHPRAAVALSPAALQDLENSFRAIDDGLRKAERDRWDPAYVVSTTGSDPEVLTDWVRERTCWIPYRGIVRGPAGVLMDRQGNSLDRAILLATLLEKAGHTVRLARAELPWREVMDLLPGVLESRTRCLLQMEDGEDEKIDAGLVATDYQLDGSAIQQRFDWHERVTSGRFSAFDLQVAEQAQRLLASVTPPADEWSARFDQALEALRDHWWVQRQDGAVWLDHDLVAAAGSAPIATVPRQTLGLSDLSASALHHEITVRVIAEQWSRDAVTERTVLEHGLRPADVSGQSIALQFWPAAWPADIHPDPASPYGLRHSALEQQEWLAALIVGREVVAHDLVTDTGEGFAPASKNPFGVFGAIAARQRSQAGTRERELTAMWIEYEMRGPGTSTRTARREVFDLVGPAGRAAGAYPRLPLTEAQRLTRSLALMTRTDILTQNSAVAPEFLVQLAGTAVAGSRDLIMSIARGEFSPSSEASRTLMAAAPPAVTPLYALALARFEWSRVEDLVFLDRPNVLTRHRGFVAAGQGLAVRDATDIVFNEVGVDLLAQDGFSTRLWQGVLDTNAEALLAGEGSRGNTADAFAVSRDWILMGGQDATTEAAGALAADTRRRIDRELESGFAIVAPAGPVQRDGEVFEGWWRIDPQTGTTLGFGPNGWGSSLTERAVLANLAVTFSRSFTFEYGLCMALPQWTNALHWLGNQWHPHWVTPAPYQNPEDVARQSNARCLVSAIAAGFLATLPLVLLSLRRARRPVFDPRAFARTHPGADPLAKTQPGADPLGKTHPGADPLGKTEPGADPLGKTQPPPPAPPGRPPSSSGRPRPPGTPPPATPKEAIDRLKEAKGKHDAAAKAAHDGTKDFVNYRYNKPTHSVRDAAKPDMDPSKWERGMDEKLERQMWERQQRSIDALHEWKEAEAAAGRAVGGRDKLPYDLRPGYQSKLPPRQPPPQFGCPPNCGNENVTQPQQSPPVPGANRTITGLGGLMGGGQ